MIIWTDVDTQVSLWPSIFNSHSNSSQRRGVLCAWLSGLNTHTHTHSALCEWIDRSATGLQLTVMSSGTHISHMDVEVLQRLKRNTRATELTSREGHSNHFNSYRLEQNKPFVQRVSYFYTSDITNNNMTKSVLFKKKYMMDHLHW